MPTFLGDGGAGAGVSALWCKAKARDRIACQLTIVLPSLDVLWLQSGSLITYCGIYQRSRAICGCRVPPLASIARAQPNKAGFKILHITSSKRLCCSTLPVDT